MSFHVFPVPFPQVENGNPNVVWSASEDGTLRQHDFREGTSCPPAGSSHQECRNILVSDLIHSCSHFYLLVSYAVAPCLPYEHMELNWKLKISSSCMHTSDLLTFLPFIFSNRHGLLIMIAHSYPKL